MAPTPPQMAAALERLWAKFLPEIHNRLAILQAASDSLAAGRLSDPERENGHLAAHKLAGVLGTFGLHRGTDLARKAELSLSASDPADATTDLSALVHELRTLIETRQA